MLSRLSLFSLALGLVSSCLFASCQGNRSYVSGPDRPPRAVVRDGVAITLRDQKLTLFKDGRKVKDYDISSSKFGIGSRNGSYRTPTGIHAVTRKVGDGQPEGMVFKACRPTGEVVPVDAAGRDPIVTRVIQISGLEGSNSNSHSRRIYIHGTPEERKIGRPASYGCIRMRSEDVVDLYRRVYRGMPVAIELCSQAMYVNAEKNAKFRSITIPTAVVAKLPSDDVRFRPSARRYKGKSYNKKSSKRRLVRAGKGSGKKTLRSRNVRRSSLVSRGRGKRRS